MSKRPAAEKSSLVLLVRRALAAGLGRTALSDPVTMMRDGDATLYLASPSRHVRSPLTSVQTTLGLLLTSTSRELGGSAGETPHHVFGLLRLAVVEAGRAKLLETRRLASYPSRILAQAQAMLDLEETRLLLPNRPPAEVSEPRQTGPRSTQRLLQAPLAPVA